MELIRQIVTIYQNYNFENTSAGGIFVARRITSLTRLSRVLTLHAPFKVYDSLFNHPLTDKGIDQFLQGLQESF